MKKSNPRVTITYRVWRRNQRTRRLHPVGRAIRTLEDGLAAHGLALRTWPDARLVRVTTLTEVIERKSRAKPKKQKRRLFAPENSQGEAREVT